MNMTMEAPVAPTRATTTPRSSTVSPTASDAARFELEQHFAAVDKILREQTDFHDLLPSFFLLSQ